jgi:hypothetical protein
MLMLLAPAGAGAQQVRPYGGGRTIVSDPGTGDPGAAPARAPGDPSSRLPLTGGDVAALAAIGVGTAAVGALATRARRHRLR